MFLKKVFLCCVASTGLTVAQVSLAGDLDIAANSMNALGIDLLAGVAKPNENALISPYSIQSALAMTYAGAAGETKTEMAKVLHYPTDEASLHKSFLAFRDELTAIHARTSKLVTNSAEGGGPSEPVTFEVANRLYGQRGYEFRREFVELTKSFYDAPLQPVDFKGNFNTAREEINRWVAMRTHERIRDVLPSGSLSADTRLALVNAVYFKAPWAKPFSKNLTRLEPFFVNGADEKRVRTLQRKGLYGYTRGKDFSVITIRYSGDDLQLLILLPDEKEGLPKLEKQLSTELLTDCANPDPDDFTLYLPKFRIEPPLTYMSVLLKSIGLHTAFDDPRGTANFERMAPRKPDDYLGLSELFHKAFVSVDEEGTEAAAVTVVESVTFGMSVEKPRMRPTEIKVDHPFLFAIQHRKSGACLFLGRVVDPR